MDVVLKAIANPETLRSQCLIVPILSEGKLSKAAKRLDKTNEGIIRSLVKRGDIEGKLNEIVLIPSVNGINAERILLLGCGRGKKLSAGECRKLLTAALNTLTQNKITDATLFPNPNKGDFHLKLVLNKVADVNIEIYDISRGVKLDTRRGNDSALYQFDFNNKSIFRSNNMYAVVILVGDEKRVMKFLVY